MVTLRTHDIVIFGGMNGKLVQKIYFLRNAKKTYKPNNLCINCCNTRKNADIFQRKI